jgi:hypothetical protein
MECPKGLEPFRADPESGKGMPLFAPAELLQGMRERWPKMWIEALPDTNTRLAGRAITYAEWSRLIEDSSKSP